jgi:hypothetical protein
MVPGLAKRTLWPAILAHRDKGRVAPRLVVGVASMDQGLASELDELHEAKPAGFFAYISWVAQLIGTVWLIIQVAVLWARQPQENAFNGVQAFDKVILTQELIQVLDSATINRGTWSIAVLGSFLPGSGTLGLSITTGLAVLIELVFLGRAAQLAHDMFLDAQAMANNFYMIFPIVVVVLEASVLIFGTSMWSSSSHLAAFPGLLLMIATAGAIAASLRVKYLHPVYQGFGLTGMWIVFGPWIVIAVAVITHVLPSS